MDEKIYNRCAWCLELYEYNKFCCPYCGQQHVEKVYRDWQTFDKLYNSEGEEIDCE